MKRVRRAGSHPSPASHPTRASRLALKNEIADHGLALSGIAVDLWGFKKPGPSIMDENPTLLRLKELETLEKVTEKVDKLTVFGGLDGVLKDVVRINVPTN